MTMLAQPDLCPCCLRPVAPKRPAARRLNPRMVAWLAALYRRALHAAGPVGDPTEVGIRAADVSPAGGDYAKMRHWGLIAPGDRAGVWRITNDGVLFLRGYHAVPAALAFHPDGSTSPVATEGEVSAYDFEFGTLAAWERDDVGTWTFRYGSIAEARS